jgi:hypothetical protein
MRYFLTGLILTAASLPAQTNVISAKAGLVHYTEGDVKLDGAEVDTTKPGKFSEMKAGAEIRTTEGRVEILLAAPSFVRLAENSGLKMLNTSLAETRFEITAGSALVEAAELEKNTAITVLAGGASITIQKAGIYRIDLEPAPTLKVYDGEATVQNKAESTVAKAGRLLPLSAGGNFVLAKFDNKAGDELYRWAKRRSGYVSMANVASANALYTRGYDMAAGSWLWNPYFGMYTGVPMRGFWRSPFGFRYFNPQMAYRMVTMPVYTQSAVGSGRTYDSGYGGYTGTGMQSPTFNSDFGYNTVGSRSSGGYSGGYSGSSGAGAAPGPGPGPAAGGGGDSGTRGGGAASAGGGQGGGGGTRGGGGN